MLIAFSFYSTNMITWRSWSKISLFAVIKILLPQVSRKPLLINATGEQKKPVVISKVNKCIDPDFSKVLKGKPIVNLLDVM